MSSPAQPALSRSRTNLALCALFVGAFVFGTAELVVVGVLDRIADGVHVSVSTAGAIVTGYALGVSIGGPALTAVSIRIGRRTLLWLSLASYVVGNLVIALSANFGMLLAARIVAGTLHGLFIGVAFAVAASLVPRERLGRAIATVFGGVTVSHVLGVPLATLAGQRFGWQASFVTVVLLGVVALAAVLLFVPPVAGGGGGGGGGFTAQARHAFAPRVLAVLGVGFLLLGGQFAALTYLTPFLSDVTGVREGLISVFLLVYGVANACGAFAGGWAADRSATRTLLVANVVLIAALGLLYLAGSVPLLAALALCLFGLSGFGLVPALQYRVVSLAGPGRDLAATLPASASNAGIAAGSLVGGWALDGHGATAVVLSGLIICAVALPFTWASGLLRAPAAAPATGETVTTVPV